MEDLPLCIIAALVPEFAVKDLRLGQSTDDDDIYITLNVPGKEMLNHFGTAHNTHNATAHICRSVYFQ